MDKASAHRGLGPEDVRRALSSARLRAAGRAGARRAAVAALLHPALDTGVTSILLIKRSERPGDRWSGQMAMPGGRSQPEDDGLLATARRECCEEVGVDPGEDSLLGSMDPLAARPRLPGRGLVVHPFAFWLDELPPLTLQPSEVAASVSVPIHVLRNGARETIEWKRGPMSFRLPCVRYDGYTIWGMTLQMLDDLFERLDGAGEG